MMSVVLVLGVMGLPAASEGQILFDGFLEGTVNAVFPGFWRDSQQHRDL